jgi:Tol biopolymer transport system component
VNPFRLRLACVLVVVLAGCQAPSPSSLQGTSAIPIASSTPAESSSPSAVASVPSGSILVLRQPGEEGQHNLGVSVVPLAGGPAVDLGWATEATWAHDGSSIHLVEQDEACVPSLITMAPDGTGRSVVRHGLQSLDFDFSWSPDGREVAFLRFRDGPPPKMCDSQGGTYQDLIEDLWVMNADGSGGRVFVPDIPINGLRSVAWSPDSLEVAFLSPTKVPGPNGTPTSVAFVRVRDGRRTESGTSIVTDGATGLAWSPDGSRLAFSFSADAAAGINHIAVVDSAANSTGFTDLITRDASGMNLSVPVWAPDGRTIATTQELVDANGLVTGAAIRILDAARPDAARDLGVTDANGFAKPTWSPDGRWLSYVREVHDANGTHPGSMVALAIDGSGRHVFEEQPSGGTSQVIDSIDWQPAP